MIEIKWNLKEYLNNIWIKFVILMFQLIRFPLGLLLGVIYLIFTFHIALNKVYFFRNKNVKSSAGWLLISLVWARYSPKSYKVESANVTVAIVKLIPL